MRSGNDVLVQVKGNQSKLLNTITTLAQQQPPGDLHHHNQLGQRSVWPVAADGLGSEWSLVRCVLQVRCHTEVFHTARAVWQPRSETAWYVCTRAL